MPEPGRDGEVTRDLRKGGAGTSSDTGEVRVGEPVRRRWLWGGVAAAAILGVAIVSAAVASGPDDARACALAGERVDAIWPAHERELAGALAAAGLDPEPEVAALLAAYASDWRVQWRAACGGARDATPASLRDLQARCLDDRARMFGELVDALRTAKRPVLVHAFAMAAQLPRLEDCGVAALVAMPPVPAHAQAGISEVRVGLARARMRQLAGDGAAARSLVTAALAEATRLDYAPVVAEATLADAELLFHTGDPRAGAVAARAAELATAARADRLAVRAYALALVDAANRPDTARVATLTPVARAAALRVGEPATLAAFDTAAASGARAAARHADALALCEHAVAQVDRLAGCAHDEAEEAAVGCLTTTHVARGDTPKAAVWAARWHAVATRRFGTDALGTLPALRELATVRLREGKLDEALAHAHQVIAITERALGADSSELLGDLGALAQMLHEAGRRDEGVAVARRAVVIAGKLADPRGRFLAEWALGRLYRRLGDLDEMHAHLAAALELGDRELAPDDDHLATARLAIGSTLAELGELDRAEALIARTAAVWTGARDPRAQLANAGLGEILERRGRCTEALPVLEAAVAGMEQSGADRLSLTRARIHLATCLSPVDATRAYSIVRGAERDARALGAGGMLLAEEAAVWLAVHRLGPAARTGAYQWASKVRAVSSQYGVKSWAATQALGAPDTYPSAGDAKTAWAALDKDAETDFIEVGFAKPERVHAIAIYETFNPGAIASVEIVTASGKRAVYTNAAPAPARSGARIHTIELPCTTEPVVGVRVTLASQRVPGWNELDAIGIARCTN